MAVAPVQLELVRENPAVPQVPPSTVTVNGATYKFTIYKGHGENWENVTGDKDWTLLAEHVSELFSKTKPDGFTTAELVLKGEFPHIEFSSAKVTYKEGDEDKSLSFDENSFLPELLEKVKQVFAQLIAGSLPSASALKASPSARADIPKKTLTDDGRCLDLALAYQVRKKEGVLDPKNEDLQALAKEIRNKAATHIMDQKQDLEEEKSFFHHLRTSINEIPDPILRDLLSDTQFEAMENILKKEDYADVSHEEMQTMRNVYIGYILHEEELGKPNQYLGQAFLSVLGEQDINCAILQGSKIIGCFGKKAELNLKDWVFVIYDGVKHYDAVDMDNEEAKIEVQRLINEEKQEILKDFLTLVQSNALKPETIKNKLIDDVQRRFPLAYKAIAELIYDYDHKKLEENGKTTHESGKKLPDETDSEYKLVEYGHWKIEQGSTAEELKEILSTFTEEEIQAKIEKLMSKLVSKP
jgi:hypothetical protein